MPHTTTIARMMKEISLENSEFATPHDAPSLLNTASAALELVMVQAYEAGNSDVVRILRCVSGLLSDLSRK